MPHSGVADFAFVRYSVFKIYIIKDETSPVCNYVIKLLTLDSERESFFYHYFCGIIMKKLQNENYVHSRKLFFSGQTFFLYLNYAYQDLISALFISNIILKFFYTLTLVELISNSHSVLGWFIFCIQANTFFSVHPVLWNLFVPKLTPTPAQESYIEFEFDKKFKIPRFNTSN